MTDVFGDIKWDELELLASGRIHDILAPQALIAPQAPDSSDFSPAVRVFPVDAPLTLDTLAALDELQALAPSCDQAESQCPDCENAMTPAVERVRFLRVTLERVQSMRGDVQKERRPPRYKIAWKALAEQLAEVVRISQQDALCRTCHFE